MSTALAVRRVRVPFRVPFETAAGTWASRASVLLELRTDDGARGIGEAPIDDAIPTDELAAQLQRLLDGPGDDVAEALRHAFAAGLSGASLDLAAGPPAIVAAIRAGVGVNATVAATDVDEAIEAAAASVLAGYRTIKLKAGAREGTMSLVERLRAVRAVVGDGIALRLDVNGTWAPDEAEARLRALEPIGLQYVEQPLPIAARDATVVLRTRIGIAIAADEAVTSPETASALVRASAADVLVVKPARVGGPSAVAAIAERAAAHGIPVVISSLFETGFGLAAGIACAASLPDAPGWPAATRDHGLATADLLEDDLIVGSLVVEDGRIRAPFAAGCGALGVTPDDGALERYLVRDR